MAVGFSRTAGQPGQRAEASRNEVSKYRRRTFCT